MKTKALLFGGCVIAAGITNSAIAALSFGGYVSGNYWNSETYQYNNYSNISGDSISWTSYYSNTLTGNQDGVFGFGSSDNPHSWWLSMTIYTSEAVVFTFSTESASTGETNSVNAQYEIIVEGGTTDYIDLIDGATISVAAETVVGFRIYTYPVNEDVSWSITFGAIPAPSALALLGLAGIVTRRRRK